LTALWRSYDTKGRENVVSIPCLVEENAETLRERYLEWIYDLGETKIKGKRIVDHLEIRPGLSYWWMTLLAQKCTYAASPHIYHAIRLLAYELLCKSTEIKKIMVTTSQPLLAREFEEWCSANNISYEQTITRSDQIPQERFSWLLKCLPSFLVGIIACFGYYIKRIHIRNHNSSKQKAIPGSLMFFDILTHFNPRAAKNGHFVSGYWTTLTNLISECKWSVNWVHIFYRHKATPQINDARSIALKLNNPNAQQSRHVIIDDYFSMKALANSLFDIVRLKLQSLPIKRFPNCYVKESQFSFKHIFGDDWHNSLAGISPAKIFCKLNSFQSYLSSVPKQRMGIYIQENQPWEIALLHSWRSNGHGEIIGTPHTTIRFWDLRYFYDAKTFQNKDKNALLIPDKVALNGPVARSAYNTGLGPIDRLIEVEALRFIETKKYKSRLKRLRPIDSVGNRKPVLLVATDLLDTNNTIQLEWAEKAVKATENNWRIVVRPHPASEFSQKKYPQWQEFVDRGDLSELLQNVDVIFCSNASSIAVDGCIAGKTILTMLNGKTFNFSPLRGIPNLITIASAKDLCRWIKQRHKSLNNSKAQYFHFNKKLLAWKQLLSSHRTLKN
jgi:surface carbohydrate biosynthesis protein (TIGR04326 family)